MTPEMNSSKPEWMDIAERDTSSAQVRKVSKKVPAIAVVVTGAIIATGAIFANASEEQNANAQVSQTQAATATPAAPPAPSQPSAPGAIQNPKIDGSTRPQRGDDSDGNGGEHHVDGSQHDGDHDGGEHHERD